MKSVLISIQPKWCELIASGKKTVEVRKIRPRIETPFKCYIYETKAKYKPSGSNYFFNGEGKVIGEFVCDRIIEIKPFGIDDIREFEKQSCLKANEIVSYLNGFYGYGWGISNLVIYDEPKGLHHFFKPCGNCDKKGTKRCTEELTDCRAKVIERPPQSWCYVESQ